MIKVKIVQVETDIEIETEMPQIPMKDDIICAWFNDEILYRSFDAIIHRFDSAGIFSFVEIEVRESE